MFGNWFGYMSDEIILKFISNGYPVGLLNAMLCHAAEERGGGGQFWGLGL